MNTFIGAAIILTLFFILMSTRILLVKDGEFRGSCASNNPMLKNDLGECTMCGAKPEEECKNPELD